MYVTMEESAKDAEPGTCIYINVTHYRKDRAVVCYAKNHIPIVAELTYSSVDLSPPGTHSRVPLYRGTLYSKENTPNIEEISRK